MLVSVLINNYNYADYLGYCIESVLNQNYKNVEIILYDDGSKDRSLEVADKYSDKIKILSTANFGKYPSYNQGNAISQAFQASSGDIICLLDSDDAFLPNKIQKVVEGFNLNKDLVMIQHKMIEIDQHGEKTNKIRKNLIIDSNILKYVLFTQRMDYFFMQTSSLSFRRGFLEKVLPFQMDDYPLIWPDVRLTRNALFFGKILTYPYPLGEYRVHGTNDSDKLKTKEFFSEFTRQHYAYFNSLAHSNGFSSIRYSKSVLTVLKILLSNFISDAGLKYKINFARSLAGKAVKKIAS